MFYILHWNTPTIFMKFSHVSLRMILEYTVYICILYIDEIQHCHNFSFSGTQVKLDDENIYIYNVCRLVNLIAPLVNP